MPPATPAVNAARQAVERQERTASVKHFVVEQRAGRVFHRILQISGALTPAFPTFNHPSACEAHTVRHSMRSSPAGGLTKLTKSCRFPGDARMRRWMTLAGYILVPGSHFGGMWRHPYSETDFCDRSLYEDVARTLERGGVDRAFGPESLSLATGAGGDYRTFVAHGAVGAIRHDPSHLVAAMAGVTRHLGFTVTLSTTYMEPYHIARIFSTLEHFSGGRMAWNIVTSAGESNAHNFGHFTPLDSPAAYRRADETLTVCSQLWNSWDEDALLRDKDSGRFADP